MELSWSQTPSTVWWALETSATSATSLTLDDRPPHSPLRTPGGTLSIDRRNMFYNYADETDYKQSKEQLTEWLKDHRSRGVIRVFQPGTSYSELIKCNIDTTTETILAKCLAKELYVHYGCNKMRKVRLDEHPLQLQLRFLQGLGHYNPYRMQLEGLREDLPFLFKFVAGQERGNRPEDKAQLSCPLKVKELSSSIMPVWNKRFCVLCSSRMFVFATSRPRGKPTLVLDLRGGTIEENKSKKYSFCLKVTTSRSVVLLAFETRTEQSKWLERAGKIISKHPLEANLAGYSLERIPKFYFLNYNIVALNLAHNYMIESFELTDGALLGQPRTIGWIDDILIFRRLVSLSLSDNCLEQFPLSLCNLSSLQELDISCNRIRFLPHEIKLMSKLTTLLLHSNQLSELPYQMNELSQLSTLVIAFNRFFELPKMLKELPALRILIASGNYISILPEDVQQMSSLQHFDIRFNKLKSGLPSSMLGLRNLTRLNIRGNGMSEINMAELLYLESLNCSDNSLRLMTLSEGPLNNLIARNNKITQFSVPVSCEGLTSIDLSRNELTALPESLAKLENLEKLDASQNKLTKLPSNIFKMQKLVKLRVFSNRLVMLPQTVGNKCPLRVLDLHSNQITSLPSDLLTNCVVLEILNVSSNCLSTLPSLSPSKEPHKLLEFYAASNSLKDNCFNSISKYRKLKVLHLAYNGLRTIPSGFFSAMTNLEYLNLSGNLFTSLPPILGCPHLRCLLLHSNKVHALPSLPPLHQLHTLDLSCNQFENLPKLDSFPHLKILDLSGNSSLVIDDKSIESIRSSSVSHCSLEGLLDIKTVLGTKDERQCIEIGGTTTHGKWSYGSGSIIGISSTVDSTAQVKSASLNKLAKDGLFGVMDGGRSPKVPEKICGMLEDILVEELASEERQRNEGFLDIDPLYYLNHTFLTIHRRLGEVGQKYGSSAVLSHLHMLPNGSYVLNVSNTGLGEAILCRSGRAVPLTTPHSPATNAKEKTRIADTKGFISQDNRVNGVCGASRLIGVYHLWPQIIPIPSTESVQLRMEDEYIIIATDSLWKHVTYDQVVHETKSISDPIQAAKRLRDLAVAHGSHVDVSVIVIKLKIDKDPPVLRKSGMEVPETVSESNSEEEDEELGVTNIDDAISDMDEGENEEEDVESGRIPITALPMEATTQDDIDRMVLGAITSPLGMESEIKGDQMMQSTNLDDLPLSDDDSPESPSPPVADSTISDLQNQVASSQSPQQGKQMSHSIYKQQIEMEYEAQTLPKIASQVKKSTGFTDLETSFEQTQSVPTLQVKWMHKKPQELSDPVSNQLDVLNAAMIQLNEEEGFASSSPGTYHVESIERPRKRGGRVSKRLSYVEHSYNKLTNDTYSGSLHHVQASPNLDTWVA